MTRALLPFFFSSHKDPLIKFLFLFHLVPLPIRALMLVYSECDDFLSVKYLYMTTSVMIFHFTSWVALNMCTASMFMNDPQALQKHQSSFISLVHLHLRCNGVLVHGPACRIYLQVSPLWSRNISLALESTNIFSVSSSLLSSLSSSSLCSTQRAW